MADKRFADRKAAGLCVRCGKNPPEEGKVSCSACLDIRSINARNQREKRGAAKTKRRRRKNSEREVTLDATFKLKVKSVEELCLNPLFKREIPWPGEIMVDRIGELWGVTV